RGIQPRSISADPGWRRRACGRSSRSTLPSHPELTRSAMKKLTAVLAIVCAAIGAASSASASVSFGVSDDAGKYANDGGYSFLAMLNDVGLTENRVTVRWDETKPTTIVDRPFLNKYVPRA